MISDVVANYNLDHGGNVVPGFACPGGTCGAPVNRRYGLDSYEFYGQDAWRIKPNLTLTYGSALVVLSCAVGDQRFPSIHHIRPGNSVRPEREEHEPGDWLRCDGVDRFQPEWSGEQRPGFLSAGKDGLVAANLNRLLAAIRFRALQESLWR